MRRYRPAIEDLDPITARVVRDSGVPELAELLAERMPATDLRSLLLHVSRRRSRRSPADLLADRARDRTLDTASVDGRRLARTIVDAFEAAPGFDSLALSPVAPLGLNAVLGGIDQNNVLTTIRGTEVMADPTTALALEAARRRRGSPETVRLCTATRVLRMQPFDDPASFQHFGLFALVTAGRAAPDHRFELEALREHLDVHLTLLERVGFTGAEVRVAGDNLGWVEDAVFGPLADAHPRARLELDPDRTRAVGYYRGLLLSIDADSSAGGRMELVDGGATDWTARLLSDRKERLFVSGIGLDRVAAGRP